MNKQNLIPYNPGTSGNLAGRPKGAKSLSTILRSYLDKEIDFNDPFTQEKIRQDIGSVIALQLIYRAVKFGDIRAIAEIFDRSEGKALQKTLSEINITKIEVEIVNERNQPEEAQKNEESQEENLSLLPEAPSCEGSGMSEPEMSAGSSQEGMPELVESE
jgi:DNA primase large subunit